MEFTEVINHRFSCKKFDGRPVKKDQLQAILTAGSLAPTAKNNQEQRIYVAESPDALAKIDKFTPCRYNAGTVIVVAYNSENVFTYPGGKQNSGAEDAAIVATHMMLAACDVGIDSCWLNFFDPDLLAQELGLPENEQIVMLLDLGYRVPGTLPLANHTHRKTLDETVAYI